MSIMIVAALLVSGVWSELDRLNPILALTVIAILFWIGHEESKDKKSKWRETQSWRQYGSLWDAGSIICFSFIFIPSVLFIFTKHYFEFPFSGDHDHHAAALIQASIYWKSTSWILCGWILASGFLVKAKATWIKYWPAISMIGLWLLSTQYQAPQFYFSRYPATLYGLASGWYWLFDAAGFSNALFALEWTNFLAFPFYALLLRPILIGEKWCWATSILWLVYFWNPQNFYYFHSSYLEAWSVVILALGLEALIKNKGHVLLPLTAVALASVVKEQAILLLPFVALAQFAQKMKSKVWVIVGAAAPFLSYYVLRISDKIWRKVEPMSLGDTFATERLHEWSGRYIDQWGYLGGVLLILLAATAWVKVARARDSRRFLWLLLGAIFQVVFFFSDSVSRDWTGYPRFHMMAYFFILSVIWIIDWKKDSAWQWKTSVVTAILVIGSSLLSSAQALVGGHKSLYAFEHHDSPQYFPIRELLGQASLKGWLRAGDSITVLAPTPQFHVQSIALGYRDLVNKYRFAGRAHNPSAQCVCDGATRSILALFPLPLNQAARSSSDLSLSAHKSCIEQVQATCQNYSLSTSSGSAPWGIIGVGKK